MQWLSQPPRETRSWYFVWQEMVVLEPDNPEFMSASVRWLRAARETTREWQMVWRKLAAMDPQPTDLQRLNQEIEHDFLHKLSSQKEEPDWGRGFLVLQRKEEIPPEYEQKMLESLDRMPKDDAWARRWQILWGTGTSREALAQRDSTQTEVYL